MAVGDVPAEPRVVPSLKQAWQNIWPSFWWLLLFGFLSWIAGGNLGGADSRGGLDPVAVSLDVVGFLVGVFVGMPLTTGLVKAHLAASRGQKPAWQDLGYAFGPRYWPSIGLGLLSTLIVIGGLLLLIIPGIYWGVRLIFAQQRFVEDGLGVRDAVRASFADTKGRWWSCFGLALMAIPLIVAGVLALLVGLFVALVLIEQMWVVYWRAVQAERGPYRPSQA